MAIRLRRVNGYLVALCAARSVEKPGDVYLDDGQHHALAEKFAADFQSEGYNTAPHYPEETALREQEEANNPARQWWDRMYENQQPSTRDPSFSLSEPQTDPVREMRSVRAIEEALEAFREAWPYIECDPVAEERGVDLRYCAALNRLSALLRPDDEREGRRQDEQQENDTRMDRRTS